MLGPYVSGSGPMHGPPGTMVTVSGRNFAPARWDNTVRFGGVDGLVVSASSTSLRAIVPYGAADGPVEVETGGRSASSTVDFVVDPFPAVGTGGDGPPIFFHGAGEGQPSAGVDPIGTPKVLVVCCNATDKVPSDPSTTRSAIMTEFDHAVTYYDQVSYGRTRLDLDYTVWVALGGAYTDYVDASINNIDNPDGLNRIMAEAAQGAVDQGLDLDDYVAMAVVLFLDGGFIRAWGGWSSSNFSYSDAATSINITTSAPLGLMAIGDNADWGRFAHEVAHNFVDAGAVLGEDVYSSDLVDPAVATAQSFDLMGNHDSHPCFSAHFMQQLGYWDASNVVELDWDRNPFSQTYTLQAHGSVENAATSRAHALRIKIGSGLFYYVEVRERNGGPGNSLVFDTAIPVGSGTGGVLVTKVFTDRVDLNQEMRFVTLLHDALTQSSGAVIEDPLRGLRITVGAPTSTNPLVVDVGVEWAQTIGPNPAGTFDLEMSQSGASWVSDDVWVDRQPWGISPEQVDGSTVATLERPRPGETNRLYAQVRCTGADAAADVKMTYYAISPPGVGDNGAWAPIATTLIPSIASGGSADAFVRWTPTVGEHTCLKVVAGNQFGEVSPGNNQVQENVFHFAAPASSPPDPVTMTFCVRNPREEKVVLSVEALGAAQGYVVHVPHRWVEVDARGERRLELTVLPTSDIKNYLFLEKPGRRSELPSTAWGDLVGRLPHSYDKELPVTGNPGSTHRTVGGIGVSVTPKHRGDIRLDKDESSDSVYLTGQVRPAAPQQRVTLAIRPERADDPMVVDVLTDDDGRFWAQIPLKALLGHDGPWAARKLRGGRFEAWAETTSSQVWAPTRSEPVYFDVDRPQG
ncbi:IPT/TIG domain-containing protein [Ornithinimicrobium avium]|uniref:IPT/TIG domain-containing protein n=1 Tax=Ornithinimicrobium avium TaxID=2283195 RepID=A0A345NMX3_9MICO|nr:IPT/TIG domain-containing protein [Ornithinimicrobium avium]AXH96381.1 hypothetical protein DV701_09840 [Ornithinimicrobium avium]